MLVVIRYGKPERPFKEFSKSHSPTTINIIVSASSEKERLVNVIFQWGQVSVTEGEKRRNNYWVYNT